MPFALLATASISAEGVKNVEASAQPVSVWSIAVNELTCRDGELSPNPEVSFVTDLFRRSAVTNTTRKCFLSTTSTFLQTRVARG